MSYHLSKFLLLRLPVFSTAFYRQGIRSVLSNPLFQAGLFLASPTFYNRLRGVKFNTEKLSDKELNTLKKYVNRSCFRPTPFGLFSSFSLCDREENGQIIMAEEDPFGAYIAPDQLFSQQAGEYLLRVSKNRLRFEGNATIYRVHKDYRFIRNMDAAGRRTYHLQSTDYSLILKNLLHF
ncbi:lantibiotic dehydratase [Mucilaginibacter sp. Mucisp86]|uniref:lantibiotic dehydratase n=1 Tax=Mucilaginibacter sp. Mucisp86 TaxID=3243060 RepID=UPI0039B59282